MKDTKKKNNNNGVTRYEKQLLLGDVSSSCLALPIDYVDGDLERLGKSSNLVGEEPKQHRYQLQVHKTIIWY